MITVITDEKEIENLYEKFHRSINKYFTEKINCWVGYPGGNFEDDVHYSEDLNLWISIQKLDNRYWNGFGIGKPIESANNSLSGEINFPYKGINRKVSGLFAKEDNGDIIILHRGRIRGGKELFLNNFRGDFVKAYDDGRETEFCLVGDLSSIHFPKQVANFISEIYRIKHLDSSFNFNSLADFKYTNEHFGTSITERNDPIEIHRTHGIIVNSLAKVLQEKRLSIGNDRNRDLFIHRKGKIEVLFEIKTSSSTQCLYSAVGQLLIYSIPIKNNLRLIAVLPEKLSKSVTNKFNSLNIEILYYKWVNDNPIFIEIDNLIKT